MMRQSVEQDHRRGPKHQQLPYLPIARLGDPTDAGDRRQTA
ncbi:MAG: hypothetical protein QOF70_6169, partial [Acetobacteraceae bacterium]|nr:hypothetical protein [Acetobacteraceae bacterium]